MDERFCFNFANTELRSGHILNIKSWDIPSHIKLVIQIADVACSQLDAYINCLQSIPCQANDTLYTNVAQKLQETSSMEYLCTPEARQGLQFYAFGYS